MFQCILRANILLQIKMHSKLLMSHNDHYVCSRHVMLQSQGTVHVLKVDFSQRDMHTARPALRKKIASSSSDLSKDCTMRSIASSSLLKLSTCNQDLSKICALGHAIKSSVVHAETLVFTACASSEY